MQGRQKVVIGCSQTDRTYLDDLKVHLEATFARTPIQVWDEYRGTTRAKLLSDLSPCRAAIVLVSRSFVAMDAVANGSFAADLQTAIDSGVRVLVVELTDLDPTRAEDEASSIPGTKVDLGGWMLEDLTDDAQDRVWAELVDRLADTADEHAVPTDPSTANQRVGPWVGPLGSHISRLEPSMKQVVDEYRNNPTDDPTQRFATAIRKAYDVDLALVTRDARPGALTGLSCADGVDQDQLTDMTLQLIGKHLSTLASVARAGHGIVMDLPAGNTRVMVAPVALAGGPHSFVAMVGRISSEVLVDGTGAILASGCRAARTVPGLTPERLESELLDGLRRSFGRLPRSMYVRRRELFANRLRTIDVHFQPVVHLHPEHPTVDSWEALARDPFTGSAPVDLFEAAELWGRRFTLHLDEYMLIHSTHRYRHACEAAGLTSVSEWRPLAVNAYPDSLMNDSYLQSMKSVIGSCDGMPGNLMTVELSERLPLPLPHGEIWLEPPPERFRSRLQQYVALEIGVAIDDFGVGDSSVARLGALRPQQVKIDRELIMQPHPELAIDFVRSVLMRAMTSPSKIVAEGIDEFCPLGIGDLFELGIRYVQGYLVGMPSPGVNHLTESTLSYIRGLLEPVRT